LQGVSKSLHMRKTQGESFAHLFARAHGQGKKCGIFVPNSVRSCTSLGQKAVNYVHSRASKPLGFQVARLPDRTQFGIMSTEIDYVIFRTDFQAARGLRLCMHVSC
jgi:hypothetical protein